MSTPLTDWLEDAIYNYDLPDAGYEAGVPSPLEWSLQIPLDDLPDTIQLSDWQGFTIALDDIDYVLDDVDISGTKLLLFWEAAGDA